VFNVLGRNVYRCVVVYFLFELQHGDVSVELGIIELLVVSYRECLVPCWGCHVFKLREVQCGGVPTDCRVVLVLELPRREVSSFNGWNGVLRLCRR
jgi:hypothetical protein